MPSAKTIEDLPSISRTTRDEGAHAEEKIGDRLAAHESDDQRLHDGGLRRGENRARVAGRGFAELEGVGQQDDGEAGGGGRGEQRRGISPSPARRAWSRASSRS